MVKKESKEVKLSWEEVKKTYEKKFDVKIELQDFSTPELVAKYIEKYRLDSSSAEVKLLSTPELVAKYIEKYELYSSSAEVLLSTPELVAKYIEKYELDSSSATIIFSFNLKKDKGGRNSSHD
ncbi:MAG: hypothetical protein ISS23_00350 [Nanoarchaeota archaeon]|nr:hypothetical protein [Nanoarchaeota archaeon]